MEIKSAKFIKSGSDVSQCPPAEKPEYAFIGRSNVGKSSLINMLVNNKSLAKTSSTPGKTQLINHFEVNENWYLVDLPGYGFAKTARTNRESWKLMIRNYLLKRENLMCVFVLVDSRIAPQKNDLEFINWLGQNHIPLVIAFTKTDKMTKTKAQKNIDTFISTLLEIWEVLPQLFITSSEKKSGREEILQFISETNEAFKSN